MSKRIDLAGVYVGEFTDAGVSLTQAGKPQFAFRFTATQKYVESADEIKHFGLAEPGYVDWSSFEEEGTGFLLLFNHDSDFSEETKMKNYEQLVKIGWDGQDFETLASLIGKPAQFRLDFETYNEKTALKVKWIDAADASPVSQLKTLDPTAVKALAKIKIGVAAKPAVAKPAVAKPATAAAKANPTPAAAAATTVPTAAAPKTRTKSPPPAKTADPEAGLPSTSGLPTEIDRDQAWESICERAGATSPKEIESAWIAATSEVGPDETVFTPKHWAQVRDICLKDLAIAK